MVGPRFGFSALFFLVSMIAVGPKTYHVLLIDSRLKG